MKDYKKELEKELEKRGLDVEIDMWRCGNLDMVCKATLESLLAGNSENKGFPSCVRVFEIQK